MNLSTSRPTPAALPSGPCYSIALDEYRHKAACPRSMGQWWCVLVLFAQLG